MEHATSIFPGKSIPLRLGLVSQSKQGFDKWKSRCAVTWSHCSKSAARLFVGESYASVCFYSCEVPPLPDPLATIASKCTFRESVVEAKDKTFPTIRARNRQRLTNVISLSNHLKLASCLLCEQRCGQYHKCRTSPSNPQTGNEMKRPGCYQPVF